MSSRLASQMCRPDRIVFLTTHKIRFNQYDALGTSDTGLCTILFISVNVPALHHT